MSLSLTKYNILLIWPEKVQKLQRSWLPNAPFLLQETYNIDQSTNKKNTLDVLKDVIKKLETWRPVQIILLGNKLRYRLIEHPQQLSPIEFQALAEHQFKQVIGHKAFEWQYFTQRVRPKSKNLTVAAQSTWLDSIQLLLNESHIRFFSIQPAAAWLFNTYRKQLTQQDWNAFRIDSELFIFKLNKQELDHFKHAYVNTSLTVENILRREMLTMGDDPEKSSFTTHQLSDLIKDKGVDKQSSLMPNQPTQQKSSS